MKGIQAFVFGRVAADLYPLQTATPLEDVETFRRFVGGFGGNVGTGLARLGVSTAVLSAVGDDGHGRFLRNRLAADSVETRWIGVHPTLRTALAFCELWPPDRFPLTLYRRPTCPDWEIGPSDLPLDDIAAAPVLYVSGTALAQDPSRSAVHAALATRRRDGKEGVATILDLDWRSESWARPAEYPTQIRAAIERVDIVIGGVAEFAAAGASPEETAADGTRMVFLKRGPNGAVLLADGTSVEVEPIAVEVVNGLGAGDAFAAAIGAGLIDGLPPDELLQQANAAGAMVTMQLPCAAAMPTRSELDDFIRERT